MTASVKLTVSTSRLATGIILLLLSTWMFLPSYIPHVLLFLGFWFFLNVCTEVGSKPEHATDITVGMVMVLAIAILSILQHFAGIEPLTTLIPTIAATVCNYAIVAEDKGD